MVTTRLSAGVRDNSITALLAELNEGNRDAEAQLIDQVYAELRRVARHYMRLERVNHTLQPTALVHGTFTRLVQEPKIPWQNRTHFFATASHLMRHILVDHARAHQARKPGRIQQQVTLDEAIHPANDNFVDVLTLQEALEHLTQFDSRQGRIVELHFFGGLSFEEIALVLHISERTAKGDWSMARAWLKGELSGRP